MTNPEFKARGAPKSACSAATENGARTKKKIATAIYQYQADGDGEWGEIHFDFETGNAEIIYLAELDTTRSHIYAKKAMQIIFEDYKEKLPKEKLVAFPRW